MTNIEYGIGLRFLLASPLRFGAAIAAVAVAVVIMFVELGLLLGILNSQAMIASLIDADLVVMDEAQINLHKWNDLRDIRLHQIAALPEIADVAPIYEGTMDFRNPPGRVIRRIVVFAFPADDIPFDIGNRADIAAALKMPENILFDRRSRHIFGHIIPGRDIELDRQLYRVAGFVDIGPDIVNDGAVVMSDGAWLTREPGDQPIMGAIRLKQGADVEAARAHILAQLPADVSVMTPQEVRQREFVFTLRSAPIGILFGIGMLAGLVIGAVTCYQILFNEIVDRFAQYATLKAMGFSGAFFRRIILEQAVLLSSVGFIMGSALTWLAYDYFRAATALAVRFDAFSTILIMALTLGMTIAAGLFALREVANADPAELY